MSRNTPRAGKSAGSPTAIESPTSSAETAEERVLVIDSKKNGPTIHVERTTFLTGCGHVDRDADGCTRAEAEAQYPDASECEDVGCYGGVDG